MANMDFRTENRRSPYDLVSAWVLTATLDPQTRTVGLSHSEELLCVVFLCAVNRHQTPPHLT